MSTWITSDREREQRNEKQLSNVNAIDLYTFTISDNQGTSLISHFTMINNQLTDNIFEAALIDTYCTAVDISSCDFNNNENNGKDASLGGCMYIDTTDLYIVNSNFNTCQVPDCGGTIDGDSFRDNAIVRNDGGCMALYYSSMICDEYTFYNMSGNNKGGTIYRYNIINYLFI